MFFIFHDHVSFFIYGVLLTDMDVLLDVLQDVLQEYSRCSCQYLLLLLVLFVVLFVRNRIHTYQYA